MYNIANIPMINVPFADDDQSKVTDLGFLENGVSNRMIIPTKNGGTPFTRQHLNGIGYFATLGAFLDRIGYPYGIRRDTGSDFNGYPKGAILITEDDDYVREYVSQVDNNVFTLPQEADDGTYVGNDYWKPTLPPTANFFPDFSVSDDGYTFSIIGEGRTNYTPKEDGWYELAISFYGKMWDKTPEKDNALSRALCSIRIATSGRVEIGRLDGRFAVLDDDGIPMSSILIPLSKGIPIIFIYTLNSALNSQSGYDARIVIKKWGESEL